MTAAAGNGIEATLAELVALRIHARRGAAQQPRLSAAPAGGRIHGTATRGMEFSESRPYRAGDDVRSVDWRQSARRGAPYTKLFQEERERPVQVLVDLGRSMRFGTRVAFKSVLAARAAALLAWQAVAWGDRIGGIVCDGEALREVRPQARQHGALVLLQQIAAAGATLPASVPASAPAPLAAALPAFRRSLRPGSVAFVLSDFHGLDAGMADGIAALAERNDVVLVQIYDACEAQAPAPGVYGVTDGEQSMTLDLRSAAARADYAAPFAARRASLERLARHPRVRLLPLATHDDPAAIQACLRSPLLSSR